MSTIAFIVGSKTFYCAKEILISGSEYFRDLLTEFNDITVIDSYSQLDEESFNLFLKWLNGQKKDNIAVDEAFKLFRLLDRFLVTNFDLMSEIGKLQSTGTTLIAILKESEYFYGNEISSQLIDILAKFYRSREDLSSLAPELVTLIKKSPWCRQYPLDIADLLYYLEDKALEEAKINIIHIYVVTESRDFKRNKKFIAYGMTDLLLKIYDNYPIYDIGEIPHVKHDPIKWMTTIANLPFEPSMLSDVIPVPENVIIFEKSSLVLNKPEYSFGIIGSVTDEYTDLWSVEKQIFVNRLLFLDKFVIYLDNTFVGLAEKKKNFTCLTHLRKNYKIHWEPIVDRKTDSIEIRPVYNILKNFSDKVKVLQKSHNVSLNEVFEVFGDYRHVITYILENYNVLQTL